MGVGCGRMAACPSSCTTPWPTRSRRSPSTPRTTATRCPGSSSPSCSRGLESAAADPEVKVVLITSAGRVFCSGADLSEASSEGMDEGTRRIVALQRLIVSMDKPVVTRLGGAGPGRRHRHRRRLRHRGRRRGRHVRAHRGQARARGRDHLAHRARPDGPAGRGPDHARRRGLQRHRGGGVRPGDDGGAGRRASTPRSPGCARRSPPAPPRGCASPSGSSTATCSPASTPTATRWPSCRSRLFASDEAREAMTAFLSRKK